MDFVDFDHFEAETLSVAPSDRGDIVPVLLVSMRSDRGHRARASSCSKVGGLSVELNGLNPWHSIDSLLFEDPIDSAFGLEADSESFGDHKQWAS